MVKIVLATANPHKVDEVNAISEGFGVEFILPPAGFDPLENGSTFVENALIKAKEAWRLSKTFTLADDSGLCVDALDGAPGLYSARYAGTQNEKIQKLLDELKDVEVEKRSAKFVCAMVLLGKDGEILHSFQGECKGSIGFEPKGENGFGYDPIFVVEGADLTMAQMSEDVKNRISHRAVALNEIIEFIQKNLLL